MDLKDYEIPYHLSAGTLLGIIREGDLLPWDTDIDLSVYTPFIPIIYSLKEILLKKYNIYISRFQKGDKLLRVKKNYKAKKIYNVVDNYYDKPRYLWRLSFNGTNKNEGHEDEPNTFRWIDIYGSHWFPKVKNKTFKDIQVYLPINSDKYLNEIYGNWRKPVVRKDFVRPPEGQPIYYCTIMSKSQYAKNNKDDRYIYIDEFICDNFLTIGDFINKYKFLQNFLKNTIEKTNFDNKL